MQPGGTGPISDEEIRRRLIAQPEEGWRRFWERHGGYIQRVIRRFSLHSEDSEEILQELSLRLVKDDMRLLRSWDPGRCVLRGYLAVVTTSVCQSYLRSAYRLNPRGGLVSWDDPKAAPSLLPLLSDPAPGPSECLQRQELAALLKGCLESWEQEGDLKSEDRRLLEMRLCGAGNCQTAATLGISQGNAAIRYHRLKQPLRQRLARLGLRTEDLVG